VESKSRLKPLKYYGTKTSHEHGSKSDAQHKRDFAQTGIKGNKCVNLRSEHRSTGLEEHESNESSCEEKNQSGKQETSRQRQNQQQVHCPLSLI
jgi:hypothetical protein